MRYLALQFHARTRTEDSKRRRAPIIDARYFALNPLADRLRVKNHRDQLDMHNQSRLCNYEINTIFVIVYGSFLMLT